MPVTIHEKRLSRESNVSIDPYSNTITLDFVIGGTGGDYDDFQARELVNQTAPLVYAGLYRQNATIKPLGGGFWDVRVYYSPKLYGEFARSFDTSGGTGHITVSKETVRSESWVDGVAEAPDFKGSIGAGGDTVEGCDITVPVFAYQETHTLPNARITQAYVEILFTATGRTNIAIWRLFPALSVLFLGVSGSQRGSIRDPWELTYKFAVSPHREIRIGNSENVILKEGWNYLWSTFRKSVDNNKLVHVPEYSYVERLYDPYDFTLLGIGV